MPSLERKGMIVSLLSSFLILHKMVQCMSKDFPFTTIPDMTDIGSSRDPLDLKTNNIAKTILIPQISLDDPHMTLNPS